VPFLTFALVTAFFLILGPVTARILICGAPTELFGRIIRPAAWPTGVAASTATSSAANARMVGVFEPDIVLLPSIAFVPGKLAAEAVRRNGASLCLVVRLAVPMCTCRARSRRAGASRRLTHSRPRAGPLTLASHLLPGRAHVAGSKRPSRAWADSTRRAGRRTSQTRRAARCRSRRS
jgi:hypothetical protein